MTEYLLAIENLKTYFYTGEDWFLPSTEST